MLNLIIEFLLKNNKVAWLLILVKYSPDFIRKKSDLNLWHLACKYQIKDLLYFANQYRHDINNFDKRGLTPVHQLIESSFYLDDNLIKFNMDIDFLYFFLSHNPDINIKWKNLSLSDEKRIYSKNNISGTPIEVLIATFWSSMAIKSRDDLLDYYALYEKVFLIFCKHGANINFLSEGQDFGKNDTIQDAMQKLNNTIISHFFIKFVEGNKDLYVLKPLFKTPTTDFSVTDENKNNLLHNFFSRISRRHHKLEQKLVEEIIIDICENSNFKEENLKQKNNFSSTPLDCLKDSSSQYKKIFENFFLKEKLEKFLLVKQDFIEKKRNKI